MAKGGGYAFPAPVVECHYSAVAERQLYLSLTLLTGYLSCHGTVNLVGEPVLAGYCLELQHSLHALFEE